MRVALTAGFDRALHVVLLAESLVRRGHEIACVVVVTPFDVARLRALMRQRGAGFVLRAAGRVFGRTADVGSRDDELLQLAESSGVRTRTLREFCATHGVPRVVVKDLNGEAAIRALRTAAPDVVAYGGGGILRRAFLEACGGKVLNAHSGPLPQIRGMNACEWSLLIGLPPVVTIHWIDEGIDTGSTVDVVPVDLRPGDTVDRLRSRCAALGVEAMANALDQLAASTDRRGASPRESTAQRQHHRQCFVLAPVLREILERRLAEREHAGS
jgi:folate-dependent phosphoribosylglycinamide formyltransferase PurN